MYELWTVNDVTGKDPLERPRRVITVSVEAFHLERLLISYRLKFEGGFQVKYPHRSGSFPVTSLTVHSVCCLLRDLNILYNTI